MNKQVLKVSDVMSPLVHTCRLEDSLERAAQLLWENDCGCLPIVDGNGAVQAMITDRDICMAAYTSGCSLSELGVPTSMSSGLVVCAPDDELAMAAERMVEHQVRRLPVVDEGGRLQGLLSVNDMACAAVPGCTSVINDPAAAESLKILMAVCRHRGAETRETTQENAEIQSSPAIPPRSSKATRKTPRAKRARHESAG